MPRAAAILLGLFLLVTPAGPAAGEEEPRAAAPRLLFDFESGTFEGWKVTGDAFGPKPIRGEAHRQSPVYGYLGSFLANSFARGDGAKGRLRSPGFDLDRPFLRFLVGGGCQGVAVKLEVDGRVRFEATGYENEWLMRCVWDVRLYQGKRARLVIEDESDGHWGHILVDHVELIDDPGSSLVHAGVRRRIYDPSQGEKTPWYVNDHTFARGQDGTWRLFGTTHPEPADPVNESLLGHASSPALATSGWTKHKPALTADPAKAGEYHLWAPHVVRHDGRWWMIYAAGDPDPKAYRFHLATSTNLRAWKRHEKNPLFTDGYHARDPHLVRRGEGWLLYYTATSSPAGGNHCVKVRTSKDLLEWSEARIVYRDAARGTHGGPTEAPHVFERKGWWYLLIGNRGGDAGTDVLRSRDPFNFTHTDSVGHLHHTSAEVVRDRDGQWYVSHAGWGQGGVWLAPLYFADP